MLAPLLASLLGAISPPRAPADASLIIHAPRLDQLEGVLAFFEAAGKRAPLLRVSSWRTEFHPILDVDIARMESLAAAGIDPTSAATVSFLGDDRVTCATLRDAKSYEARVAQRLARMGDEWNSQARGAALRGATSAGRVIAGYAIRRRQTCAVSSSRNGEALLREASKLLETAPEGQRWAAVESLPGRVYVLSRQLTVGLSGGSASLSIVGRASGIGSLRFKPGSSSPYADFLPKSLLFMRAHLESASLAEIASSILPNRQTLCSGCDERELKQVLDAAVENLTGSVLLRVDGARLLGPLKTPSARYFAVKHAYLAEVKRPAEMKKALERAALWRNARRTADGLALSVEGGEIQIGLLGSHFYIGNDAGAVTRALQALSDRPGKLTHGAEFSIDARQISLALSQISLFDALSSHELAPLLAISAEVGPLLEASRQVRGWVDTTADGAQRFALTWTLLP